MKKLFSFFSEKMLFPITLFLLVFIPLYPKLPLLDIKNTWVYIRLEDVVIALVLLFWISLVLTKKVNLKTPLTFPIFIFWIIGGVATLHGVMVLFPTLSNVFSNVALLNFLRRIEYLSLFFVAYQGIKEKRYAIYVIWTLITTFLLVIAYGFGQKFLGFPAYLTMNEEFAKGIPIQLSQLSRVPSTFAGHYDLAAYLVLILPILASLFFGFKNIFIKALLVIFLLLGFGLMFMTVSRISFFVLLLSLLLVLILQKRKILVLTIFVVALFSLSFSQNLLARFGNTVKEVNVLVDADTGKAIGHPSLVSRSFFDDKLIYTYVPAIRETGFASPSAFFPDSFYPTPAPLITSEREPTGEDLPQGTGYINLPLSPIIKRTNKYFYQNTNAEQVGTESSRVTVIFGDYVVKKALAYDLSFTTRFQGEWPKTIMAFKRNIFLGSGYSSVTLAVDNDYLRILGETGLLGFISFLSIFIVGGIYIRKLLPKVDSRVARSLVLGFVAGTFGLALNALFIDVFEASKVAFTYWLLMGVVLGILNLYKTGEIDLRREFIKAVVSPYAIVIYLFFSTVALYIASASNYFVGDDFTWLRWAADCTREGYNQCPSIVAGFVRNFSDANNFFYRPGAKLYFSAMYSFFWLNQNAYHFVSFFLHFLVAVLMYLLAKRMFKNNFLGACSALLFLILSGSSEAVFWISSTGFLFTTAFTLASILSFAIFRQTNKKIYLILSLAFIVFGLMFHELGIVAPFLIILFDAVIEKRLSLRELLRRKIYLVLTLPILPYLLIRFVAQSHWTGGDYSYNLVKLPFNVVGNLIGYLMITFLGPAALSFYSKLRTFSRDNIGFSAIFLLVIMAICFIVYKYIFKKIPLDDKRIVIFAVLFFVISLLPFLGLGNIASRYGYLAAFGPILLFILFIKYMYGYLMNNGKSIAILCIVLFALVFVMIQTFQLQKIERDWFAAGEVSRRLLVSLNKTYSDRLREEKMQFYFTGVPIRQGEAWIFPVGLPDAIWFTFKDANVAVHITDDPGILKSAISESKLSDNVKVFQFDKGGNILNLTELKTEPALPLE